MNFYELIEKYGKGASDEKMKKLTMVLSEYMDDLKHAHKERYWCMMRDVMGVLNDNHYDEKFAEHDVENIEYTGKEGVKHKGAYWSLAQAEEAMKKVQLPSDANKYDWWVALSATYSDLCTIFDEEQIIKTACVFWFKDQDWGAKETSSTKIWEYMRCKYSKK